ncbi:MAG: hypothetical protein KBD64_05035 [Gammaproteobacteria bacterium]|nr:hypothetical protein [Gammaproteobacteria bacterium]
MFRNGRKCALITVKDEGIRSDRYVIFPELSASLPLELVKQKVIDGTYRVDDTQLLKITDLRTTYVREGAKAIKDYRDKKYAEAKSGYSKVFGCLKAICSLAGADAKEEHIEAEKQIAVVFYNVGSIYIQLGDYTQALGMTVCSLDIRKKYFRAEDAEIVKTEAKIREIKLEQAAFELAVATPLPTSDITPRLSV